MEYSVPQNVADILVWADVIFSNIFSRAIGFIVRVFVLLVFVVMEFITLTAGVVIITLWILLPVLLIYGLFLIPKINV